MEKQKLYAVVNSNIELPETEEWNFCITKEDKRQEDERKIVSYYRKGSDYNWGEKYIEVTHWLKPIGERYALTKDEIEKLVSDAFNAGEVHEYEKHFGAVPPLTENNEQYIKNLNL